MEAVRYVEHRLWDTGPKGLGLLSNSEVPDVKEAGSERGRGKPAVRKGMQPSPVLRAPSAGSVSNQRASVLLDNWEVGSEAAILQRVRNSSPVESMGTENGRG